MLEIVNVIIYLFLVGMTLLAVHNFFAYKFSKNIQQLHLEEVEAKKFISEFRGELNFYFEDIADLKSIFWTRFIMSFVATLIGIGLYYFMSVAIIGFSLRSILDATVIYIVLTILKIIDKIQKYRKHNRFIIDVYEYEEDVEYQERMTNIRIFYVISSYLLIIILLSLDLLVFNQEGSNDINPIIMGIIAIYLGGVGYLADCMILKLPIDSSGTLQKIINVLFFIFGLWLLITELLNFVYLVN